MATEKKDYTASDRVKALQDKGMSERDAILVSMKKDKKPKGKKSSEPTMCCGPDDDDGYPYGLEISLENESLKKLGLNKLPEVGTVVELRAKAIVESVSQSAGQRHGESKSVRLQITDLSIESEGAAEPDDSEDEEVGE